MKKRIIAIILIAGILAGGLWYVLTKSDPATPTSQQPSVSTPTTSQPAEFNKTKYSTTEPSSIWFIANKHFALPLDYEPSDLTVLNVPLRLNASEMQMKIRKVAATDLSQLFADAKTAGLQLQFGSGYRSAAYQKVLYDGYVASMGKAEADRSSARPGYSEHQTGLALDFTRIDGKCHLEECFTDTPEGKWLAENAYKYGFILRYPKDREPVTGYMFEPWHYRYVGKELAAEMHSSAVLTLEAFFGTGPAPDYLP